MHLCQSPLDGNKLIDKIYKTLKIRADRISPSCSATFYKTGNDNNIWTISGGKWKLYKKSETQEEIYSGGKELLKKYKFIGSASKQPKFIKSITNVKNNKYKIVYVI